MLVRDMQQPQRVEAIAIATDFYSWNSGLFDGTSYRHVAPLFDLLYEYFTRGHFQSSPSQGTRKRRLERAAAEVWPHRADPENNRNRQAAFVAHLAHIETFGHMNPAPIEEWPIDRLLRDFRYYHELRAFGLTVDSAADNAGPLEGLLKGASATVVTVVSYTLGTWLVRDASQMIAEIDIEVSLTRSQRGEITRETWEEYEEDVEDIYGATPEPEELRGEFVMPSEAFPSDVHQRIDHPRPPAP